jgi:site-specific recombinase XerD
MAKLENKNKDNPRLEQRLLSDGRISLYLEYYLGRESEPVFDEHGEPALYKSGKMAGKPMFKIRHIRRKENLPYYLIAKPRTPIEKQHNKDTLELVKRIRYEREQELTEDKEGYRLKKDRRINFLDYFQAYIDNYTKKDIRMLQIALQRFKDFLNETPEYKKFAESIRPEQLNKDIIEAYTEYLQSRSIGEGAKSIYQRFKKVIKYAIEHDVMRKNPCTGIVIKVDDQILRKDVLSTEEMQRLIATYDEKQNPEVRRAFIFCLYCGLRYCDVKDLTFANVDYSNRLLMFEQNKTKGHSANSGVVIPLNDGLLKLIGEPTAAQTKDSLIFTLPSYEMCLKSLKRWVKRAGIDKHISWHCARHSFAVNILNNGANIKTVASLLGHSGLKHTEKYTRAVDKLKEDAINSLPTLELSNI